MLKNMLKSAPWLDTVMCSPVFTIKSLYFNLYGVFLPCCICDHSRHSKNKILIQLDGDSFCFLPLYAKLLSKQLNHNKLLQCEVTMFSEGPENLYCRFIHEDHFHDNFQFRSCLVDLFFSVSCFHAQSIVVVTYTDVSLIVFFGDIKGFRLCIASSASFVTCKYKLYVSYSQSKT